MSQTRLHSAAEVVTNTATGFIGSWVIAFFVMTTFEDRATAATITVLGCTVWSLVRGWTIRRAFNRVTPHADFAAKRNAAGDKQ